METSNEGDRMMLEALIRRADTFYWGTATAAYQIEGAVREGGRGESIWDTFTQTAGRVANGDTGDVAVDHYRRWRDDIDLMKQINCNAYRFSIAWPRVLPEGRGAVNQAGLDFYDRLVDALLQVNITPFVTLYHWDLPQALEAEGGWLRRGIADDFEVYADIVSRALGDRVKHWITLNEPWGFTWLGYVFGLHAPGHMTGNPHDGILATHHAYLAHGRAVEALRANSPDSSVGIALNVSDIQPASDSPEDRAAAWRYDGFNARWYLDPLFRGAYPADMLATYAVFMPEFQPGDMDVIAAPLDFLGVNYYTRTVIAHEPEQFGLEARQVIQPGEHTTMGWEVYPEGLYNVLKRLHADYHPPQIYVTENGAAFADTPAPDGQLHDDQRVDYLRRHFEAAARAWSEGVPLRGYFVWTLLDNFEWHEGYRQRFGLYYVDYATQRRVLKDSGRYFARVAGGVTEPVK